MKPPHFEILDEKLNASVEDAKSHNGVIEVPI